jgi:endonuclease YncB( thermonuclease family)
MRRIPHILLVLSILLLAACATQERSRSLTTTLSAYGGVLRWGDFASAAQFIDPKVRAEHPLSELDRARYKQVRVTEYDDGSGPVPISPTEVQQTVRLSVVNIHTQAERTVIDRQTWHYDEQAKHWWLTSGLPDITRE